MLNIECNFYEEPNRESNNKLKIESLMKILDYVFGLHRRSKPNKRLLNIGYDIFQEQ